MMRRQGKPAAPVKVPGSPSVLRQRNPRARASPQQSPEKETEGRKRKNPTGYISPESSENKPESVSGTETPGAPKKKKVGPEPRTLELSSSASASATVSTSSYSYGGEDVQLFSEVEDDDEPSEDEARSSLLSVVARNSLKKKNTAEEEQPRPKGLALKTKRLRLTETPVQQTARELAKQQKEAAQREAEESLKVLQQMVAELDQAPAPNLALLSFFQQRSYEKEVGQYSGIIKRVRLFNFMCHESFDKEWHNNLNFITGQNGSGKSAILSGILVGLGARALTTSRTKSIKGLVKTGKEFCKIEITLINYGVLSDRYGKEVMIQRIIDNNGISTYKIDDGTSRIRVLRRAELDNILATLGIMLDNPVAILNQETARSFLRSKDPRDKYHLFFEGTSLGKCKRILEEIRDDIEAIKRNFRECLARIEDQKEEKNRLKKRMEKFLELDRMDEQIDMLTNEYHWSLVIADENVLDRLNAELEKEKQDLAKMNENLETLTEFKNKLIEEQGLGPQNEEEAKAELREKGRRDKEIQLELSKLSRDLTDAKVKIRTLTTQIARRQEMYTALDEKVEHLRTVGLAEAEAAQRENEEKEAALNLEKAQVQQEVQTAKQDSEQFKHGADAVKNELNQLQDKDRQCTFALDRHRRELQALRNNGAGANKYECFGRPMVDLMAKIQANQHRFRKPPRGPIGSCFKVKNEKWLKLVEFILRDKLMDFIVDNPEDLKLLNEFIKQTFLRGPTGDVERRRPTVICSKYGAKAFDVTRTKATCRNHPTVLDAIEIENNDFIISNALIDTASIERVLLVEDNKTALDLLKDCNAPEFPNNCFRAFTLDYYRITPDPKLRIEPMRKPERDFAIVKCSSAAHLRALERGIQEIQMEKQELAPILESKRQEEAEYREKYLKLDRILQRSQRKLQEVVMRIRTQAGNKVIPPDIVSFEEELAEIREEVTQSEEELAEAQERLSRIQPKVATLKAEREEIAEQITALQQNLSEFQERHDKFQAKLEKADAALRKAKSRIRDLEVKCESMTPKVERVKEQVKKRIEEAQKHGQRVETDRSPEALQTEYQEYSKRVEEAKKEAGDRVKIAYALKTCRQKLNDTSMQYQIWHNIFHLLANSYTCKVQFFDSSVRITGQMLSGCFVSLIGFRGYKGRIMIDDEKQELIYFICPDSEADAKTQAALTTNSDKQIRQYFIEYASGLSGGERSFATICFIISMWQVMECPFFMLDEFDVFMDAFNRKTSQTALITHAKKFKAHQYFLFTPLDLTEMPKPDEATVLRMFPPVRKDGGGADSDEEELADDIETPLPGPSRRAPARRRRD